MGRKGWTILIVMFVGATIGAGIGYLAGQSVLGAVVGAGIGAVGFGLSVFVPVEVWLALAEFGQIAECCSSFFVFSLASMVTLGGLLLWHSFALAALAGVGVMTVLLVVLSAGARLGSGSHKSRAHARACMRLSRPGLSLGRGLRQ